MSTGGNVPFTGEDMEGALNAVVGGSAPMEGTDFIQQAMQSAHSVPMLFQILKGSPNAGMRQLAAVLLRKKTTGHWSNLEPDVRQEIKNGLLETAFVDPVYLVRRNVIALIRKLARHLVPKGEWNELVECALEYTTAEVMEQRESSFFILKAITDVAGAEDPNFFDVVGSIAVTGLEDSESVNVRLCALHILSVISFFCETPEEVQQFEGIIPLMQASIVYCIENGSVDRAVMAFDIFEKMLEVTSTLLTSSIEPILEFQLEVAVQDGWDVGIRRKALNFIAGVCERKAYVLLRGNIVKNVLAVIYSLLCVPEEDPDENDTVHKSAAQLLDRVCLTVAPEHTFEPSILAAAELVNSNNWAERKAGYTIVAMLAEGCQEMMRENLLQLLDMVEAGLNDSNKDVTDSAIVALGLMAEYLKPDIHTHHARILPHLFRFANDESDAIRRTAMHSIDVFVEFLEDGVEEYLEQAMGLLFDMLQNADVSMQCIVITCIQSMAKAAGEKFTPFAPQLLDMMLTIMEATDDELLNLRAHATECVGWIGLAVGRNIFDDYVEVAMGRAMDGLSLEYFMLSEFTFAFFGRVVEILGADYEPFLEATLAPMFEIAVASDLAVFERDGGAGESFALDIGSDDEEGEFHTPQGYIDMKGAIANTLGIMAWNLGPAFLPYVETAIEALTALHNHTYWEVRTAATESLANVVETVGVKIYPREGGWTVGDIDNSRPHNATQDLADHVIPMLLEVIRSDERVQPAWKGCHGIASLAKALGPAAIANHVRDITSVALMIYNKQLYCQQPPSSDDDWDENGETDDASPIDLAVLEADYCCEMLEAVIGAMGPLFEDQFDILQPIIAKRMHHTRQPYDRTSAIGIIATATRDMGNVAAKYGEELLPLMVNGLSDEDDEVQRNSVYAAGLMISRDPQRFEQFVQPTLQGVGMLLSEDREPTVIDNACGTIARLIMAMGDALPVGELLPAMVNALPLRDDFEENVTVYNCLFGLYAQNHAVALSLLPNVIAAISQILGTPMLPLEMQEDAVDFLEQIRASQAHGQTFNDTLGALPDELRANVTQFLETGRNN